jgi:hypothetical protein
MNASRHIVFEPDGTQAACQVKLEVLTLVSAPRPQPHTDELF